jgi:hypothetical protein
MASACASTWPVFATVSARAQALVRRLLEAALQAD